MNTQEMDQDALKQTVRARYGQIASDGGGCGCAPACCSPKTDGGVDARDVSAVSRGLGYTADELGRVPDGSNLGLG